MIHIFWSVVGYVRVKLIGEDINVFLEKCRKENIYLKNVTNVGDNYYADILSTHINKTVSLLKECGVTLKIEGRFGLAMKLFIYRNRLSFIIGASVFMFLFCCNSFFVKDFEITGNEFLTDTQIITLLEESGIKQGTFIPKTDVYKIADNMRKKCRHLSWVWVDIYGTTARVDVREKVSKPDFFDENYVCNIVAEKDGVVCETVCEKGILYATVGNYVRKGELLIGGVYDANEYAPVRLVHATGTVKAKTVYSLESDFDGKYITYKKGKKDKNVWIFNFFGKRFVINPLSDDRLFVKTDTKTKNLKFLGKFSLPLGFTKQKYCEIIKTEYKINREETLKRAYDELEKRISLSLPYDAKVMDTKKEYAQNPDGSFNVKLTFECIEEITEELPIEV